ncbi:MAG: hypothetical protein DRP65_00900 [Planctomycetota bacterium]|nr:MAG: hypothetical protein DRP65_00900 [Planctomycetota bacterium]
METSFNVMDEKSWCFFEHKPYMWCLYGPYIEDSFQFAKSNKSKKISVVTCHHDHTHFGMSPAKESSEIKKIQTELLKPYHQNGKVSISENVVQREKDHILFQPEPFRFFSLNSKAWKIFSYIKENGKVPITRILEKFNDIEKKAVLSFLEITILSKVFLLDTE